MNIIDNIYSQYFGWNNFGDILAGLDTAELALNLIFTSFFSYTRLVVTEMYKTKLEIVSPILIFH